MKFKITFLALILLSISHAQAQTTDYKTYYGRITKIVDGDTLHASVKIWPEINGAFKIRVRDINTPEMHFNSKCRITKTWARAAKRRVEALFPMGTRVKLENIKKDGFGRYLAHVSKFDNGNWLSLSETLLNENLAIPFVRNMDEQAWCDEAKKLFPSIDPQ